MLKVVERATAGMPATVVQSHARHILLRTGPQLSETAAVARLADYRRRIERGEATFEALAREFSQDGSAKQGGDLGWFPADAFGPDFGRQVSGVDDGGVTAPFRTDAGWHIVQRVATRQTDVGDDNKRAQIRDTIGRRKLEDEYNRFLQELRGEAYVSFRTGDRAEGTAETPPQP